MGAPVIAAAATEGAAAGTAASTAGSTAAGAASTTGTTTAAGSIASYVGGSSLTEGLSPVSALVSMVGAIKSRKESIRQFDAGFEESKRRFGLEFALREWAERQGMTMARARQMYAMQADQQQYGLQLAQAGETMRGQAQSRMQQDTTFNWQKEDRERNRKLSKAYGKGIVQGLFGKA